MAKASIYAKAFTEFRKTPEYKGMTKEEREAVHQMAREDYAGLKQRDELEEEVGFVRNLGRQVLTSASDIPAAAASTVAAGIQAAGDALTSGARTGRGLAQRLLGTDPEAPPIGIDFELAQRESFQPAAATLDKAALDIQNRAEEYYQPQHMGLADVKGPVDAGKFALTAAARSALPMMATALAAPFGGAASLAASAGMYGIPTLRQGAMRDIYERTGKIVPGNPVRELLLGTAYGAVENMAGFTPKRFAQALGIVPGIKTGTAKQIVFDWLKSSFGEGSEEVVQYGIELFNSKLAAGVPIDEAVASVLSDFEADENVQMQAVEQFAGGLGAGAVFNVGTVGARIQRNRKYFKVKAERLKAAADLASGKNVAESKKTIETLDPELAAIDQEAQAAAQPEKPLLSQDDINAILAANAPATDATRKSAAPVPMFEEEAQQGKPLLSQEDISDILAANAPRLPLATTIAEDPTIDEGIRAARMARKEREATPTLEQLDALEQSDQAQQLQAAEFVPAPIPRAPTGGTVTIPPQQPGAPRTDLAAQMAETEIEAAPYRAATILEEAIKTGDPAIIESFTSLPFAVRQQAAAILESEGVIPSGAGQGFAEIGEEQTPQAEPAAPVPMIQSPLQPTQARVTLGVEGERFTGEGVKKPSMRATGEAAPDLAVRVKRPAPVAAEAKPAELEKPAAPEPVRASSIETPAQGALATQQEAAKRARKRVQSLRRRIKDEPMGGNAANLRLDLMKAEDAHRVAVAAAKQAKAAIEKRANELGKTTKKPGREARKPTVDQVADALIVVDEMREADRGKKQYAYTLRNALPLDKWLSLTQIVERVFRGSKEVKSGMIHALQKYKKAGLIDILWTADGDVRYAWKGTKPEEGLFPESYFENMPTEPEKPAAQAPAPAAQSDQMLSVSDVFDQAPDLSLDEFKAKMQRTRVPTRSLSERGLMVPSKNGAQPEWLGASKTKPAGFATVSATYGDYLDAMHAYIVAAAKRRAETQKPHAPKFDPLSAKKYIHRGREVFVGETKNGDGYATFFAKDGKTAQLKTEALPERTSAEEAQADLDAWAQKHSLPVAEAKKPTPAPTPVPAAPKQQTAEDKARAFIAAAPNVVRIMTKNNDIAAPSVLASVAKGMQEGKLKIEDGAYLRQLEMTMLGRLMRNKEGNETVAKALEEIYRLQDKVSYTGPTAANQAEAIDTAVKSGDVTDKEAEVIKVVLSLLKKPADFALAFGKNVNAYNIAENLVTIKDTDSIWHEIGHWGYFNVLTPAERVQFMRDMGEKFYGKGKPKFGDLLAIKGREEGVATNHEDSFAEYFAEQFRQYVHTNILTEPQHRTMFEKLKDWMVSLMAKLRNKDLIDPDVARYVEKIIGKPAPKKAMGQDEARAAIDPGNADIYVEKESVSNGDQSRVFIAERAWGELGPAEKDRVQDQAKNNNDPEERQIYRDVMAGKRKITVKTEKKLGNNGYYDNNYLVDTRPVEEVLVELERRPSTIGFSADAKKMLDARRKQAEDVMAAEKKASEDKAIEQRAKQERFFAAVEGVKLKLKKGKVTVAVDGNKKATYDGEYLGDDFHIRRETALIKGKEKKVWVLTHVGTGMKVPAPGGGLWASKSDIITAAKAWVLSGIPTKFGTKNFPKNINDIGKAMQAATRATGWNGDIPAWFENAPEEPAGKTINYAAAEEEVKAAEKKIQEWYPGDYVTATTVSGAREFSGDVSSSVERAGGKVYYITPDGGKNSVEATPVTLIRAGSARTRANEALKRAKAKLPGTGKMNTVESVAAEAAVWAAKGLGKQFSKGLSLVRSGVSQFSAWAKQMVEAFGQNVKKYLREIFNAAVKVAESRRGGVLIRRNKQTQTPEFKRWFGDSKIVDESGNPLVVYHGTDKDFSVFDTTAGKKTEELHGSAALGTFFTKDPEIAEVYTGRYKKSGGVGGNIKPVYLSIKKPYLMPVAEMMALSRIPDAVKRRKQLEKAGYDGIVQAGVDGLPDTEMRQIVAFRPEQIKSAIGNVGTFDPGNPNILFSAEYLAAEYAAKGLGAAWDFAVATAEKAKTFSAFAREMLAKFGDKIKVNLRGMWEAAKRVMSSRRGGVVRLSRAAIDRATGVTKPVGEKQFTEKQALKTRLSKEQKATRTAAIQAMKAAVERFKANEATVVEVKNAVVNAMRAVLGQTQRGRADMLRAIKNAKTWKDHARIANQINKIANQAEATKLRQEIRKELSPAALKKMRDVDEDGQPLKQYLLDFVNGVSTFDPKTFGRVLGYMLRKGRDPKSPENAARLAEMQKQLDAIKAGARTIQDMTPAELQRIVDVIRMVKTASKLAGMIVQGRRRTAAKEIADKAVVFMSKNPIMKPEENTTPQKGKLRGLTEEGIWGMAEVAELAGPEAKDVLFTAPMMGTNDMKRFSQTEHDRVFAAIRKHGYDPESRRFARWLAELVDVPLSTGAVVKMTRDEMLNLVGLTMDKQNVKYAEKTGYSTRANSARHVVGTYAGNLSAMEKDVLEAVVESYNVGVREPVNAVSLIIDGIKKIVREDTFFPRRVDKREMLTIPYDEFYKWQAETLDGIGLLKDRVEHKNPLILRGAFAGWMRDIDALSRYVGLAIPLRNIDLLRRMPGFRKTAEATLGKQWDRSIGDRVKAIAGIDETPPGTLARIIKAATKVGAMSKLILNPLSVAKQFGGYLTLKPRLKYGDWWRGVQRSFLPAEIARVRELVNKHSPVLRDRYEGHSIKLLTPIVSESESALDRFDSGALVNKGLEPMKKTDFMVTAAAWIGHELEVSREMPDLKGEEFYKEVAWRTMLSVETTQNPSTVLMQSGAALEGRNDNAARLLTTFRSAPARIASMLTSAVYRYRRGEISAADVAETVFFAGAGNAMWTGVVGALGAAGLAALAGDDDEDKDGIIAQAFTRAVQDAFSIFYGGEYVEEIATRAKRSIMGQPMRKMQNEGFVMSSVAGLLEGLDLLSRASREKATGEKYESGPRKGMAKWRDTLEQATQRLAFGSPAVFPSRVAAAVFSRFTRQTSPAEAARMVAKEAPDFTEADMSEALDRLEAAGAIQFDTFGDRQKRLRGMISVGKNVVKGKKD